MILAGGLATRMGGGDKALRPYRGRTLLDAVIARVAPQTAMLALNANGGPARFARFGLPVLPDPVTGHPGPLAGVLAALDWAAARGAARVLTVPCDAPDLPDDLLERLAACDAPVAVAASADGTLHPTIALWPADAAAELRAALARDQRRVRAFAAALGMTAVPFPDGTPDPFGNINRPEDLA